MKRIMKRLYHVAFLIFCALCITMPLNADDYYRRTGTGGYGVSTKKINCPNCGKEIYANDSHMCRRVGSSTSSSSHSSSSSSGMSASEAEAIMAGHPELLVNQTSFTPVDYNSYNSNSEENSSYQEDETDYRSEASKVLHTYNTQKKKHPIRNTILIIGGIVIGWWLLKKILRILGIL